MKINIPISAGELVDKITILEIKTAMIDDEAKLSEVKNENNQLTKYFKKISNPSFSKSELFALKADLYQTNLNLWRIEDNIRKCERNKDFGEEFVRLARSVYQANDMRFNLKNNINQLTNSDIKEVKSYESYS
tara:strand:- start:1048 stop:1446 length:399 start_codon:yes stop_codon:yes gene_type:complete